MTIYVVRGSTVHPQEDADSYQSKLPAETYNVSLSMFGWYLERSGKMQADPSKVYGKITQRADRVIKSFRERTAQNRSTGVLLTGVKGSGKTMLARMISNRLKSEGMPTIIVDSTVNEENVNGFIKFMNLIDTPSVIMFDEFEKNFNDGTQSQMLTLLDGLGSGNKLFLLTVNDEFRINSFMKNRPGRIYYRFDYHGLETEFIREYLADVLLNKDLVDTTTNAIERSFKNNFTFDMLQAAVEEMNRFDIDFPEAVACLNIDVENISYKATVKNKQTKEVVYDNKISDMESFHVYDRKAKDHIYFEYDDHFTSYDNKEGGMVFDNGDYTAVVQTERSSSRSKSFFLDA